MLKSHVNRLFSEKTAKNIGTSPSRLSTECLKVQWLNSILFITETSKSAHGLPVHFYVYRVSLDRIVLGLCPPPLPPKKKQNRSYHLLITSYLILFYFLEENVESLNIQFDVTLQLMFET